MRRTHRIWDTEAWIFCISYLPVEDVNQDELPVTEHYEGVMLGRLFIYNMGFLIHLWGYDVFLGNFRGLVSREHVNMNISSRRYWKYSINEHGTQDIPAMIEKIHQTKVTELENSQKAVEESGNDQPYKLCAICHSLGGAAILMYILTRRIEGKPHRL